MISQNNLKEFLHEYNEDTYIYNDQNNYLDDCQDIYKIINSDNTSYYQKTGDIFDLGFDFDIDFNKKITMTPIKEKELLDYLTSSNFTEVRKYIIKSEDLCIDFEDISKESFFNDVMAKFLRFFLSKYHDKNNLISWINLCNDDNINLNHQEIPSSISKLKSKKRKNEFVTDNIPKYRIEKKNKK